MPSVRAQRLIVTTAALLLAAVRPLREVDVEDCAHAYWFRDAAGRDLFVAWSDDGGGGDAEVTIKLALGARRGSC